MDIDSFLYKVPVFGPVLEQTHRYFRKHITVTDLFHVLIGFGFGLGVARSELIVYGGVAVAAGLVYHLYAFVLARSSNP